MVIDGIGRRRKKEAIQEIGFTPIHTRWAMSTDHDLNQTKEIVRDARFLGSVYQNLPLDTTPPFRAADRYAADPRTGEAVAATGASGASTVLAHAAASLPPAS